MRNYKQIQPIYYNYDHDNCSHKPFSETLKESTLEKEFVSMF